MTIPHLVVSGTLSLDTIERSGDVHRDVPGGSALYGAAAASTLVGSSVAGTAGTDFPFERLATLWRRGVDPSAIEVLEGATFRWHARYDDSGDHREIIWRDRGIADSQPPVVPAMADPNCALLLGSTDPRIQAYVRDACPEARLVGLDSMSHHWRASGDALRTLLARVDIVFVNEEELAFATGVAGATAVTSLHALGPELVIVKRGSSGAELHRRGNSPVVAGAVSLQHVVDPTGAGDAFAGAFMAALATHRERGDAYALRYATAVASFAVESYGITSLIEADSSHVSDRMKSLLVEQR